MHGNVPKLRTVTLYVGAMVLINLCYPVQYRVGKIVYRLILCSSPRKSLVKGERFIRGIEEKPECRKVKFQPISIKSISNDIGKCFISIFSRVSNLQL